jgi:hypothetical protein
VNATTPVDDRLAALYDGIASRGRAALATGAVLPDPLPVDGGTRWGVSAVFRPGVWTPALATCAVELARLLGDGHAVYRADTLHVTLRQFENHRTRIPDDDPDLSRYRETLSAFASAHAPVRIALCGLAASPEGVLVQGWPHDDLQRPRRDLHDELVAAGVPLAGPEAARERLRDSAHATLAIYGGAVARAAALAAFVERHRSTDFGDCVLDTVRLVGYRRTRDDVKLIEYGAWRLDGREGGDG